MDDDDPVVPPSTVPARGARIHRADPAGVISDRFRIDDELGRGGMGRVVSAHDRVLDRVVAIKEATSPDPGLLARFEREIRITARLQHPAIVPLYDAGHRPDGTPYYVMRQVGGTTLHEAIAACGSLHERLALLPAFLAAADAIAYAHARATIHRDLKPANILVGEHGETVVIDWGLAKRLADDDEVAPARSSEPGLTSAGAIVGTPGYMAPEQQRGEAADARTDVFALGATLVHILDGLPPEHGVVLGPAVPRDLATIATKAMLADPAARYADASGLAADVRRFLTGQLVAAHRYSFGERVVRFVRRHALVLVVAVAAAGAIAATIGIAVSRVVAARDRATEGFARATDRGEDLVLARAEALLDSDPTRAALVAVSLPASSTRWAHARSIVAAARLAGIARMLPRQEAPLVMRADAAGRWLVSAGSDGVIAVHDLHAWTTRELARIPHATEIQRLGEAVAVAAPDGVHVVDIATAHSRVIATAGLPRLYAITGAVAWRDRDGVFALRDRGEPIRLATVPGPGELAASSDGSWVVTWNAIEPVRLFHDGTEVPLAAPLHGQVAFATTPRFAVATPGGVVEVELGGPAPVTTVRWAIPTAFDVRFSGKRLFALARDGEIAELTAAGPQVVAVTRTQALSVATTADGIAVSAGDATVTVVGVGNDVHVLHAPGPVRELAASSGRVFAAGFDGSIATWDLADVFGLVVPGGNRGWFTGFLADDTVLACTNETCESWRATDGVRATLAFDAPVLAATPSPGGELAVVTDMARTRSIVRLSDGARTGLGDGQVDAFAFAGPGVLVYARASEVMQQRAGATPERLVMLGAPVRVLDASATMIAVAFEGGIWLHDARTATATQLATSWRVDHLAVMDGGAVAAAGDALLHVTRHGITVIAVFGSPIAGLVVDTDRRIMVATEDAVHRVTLAGGVRTTPIPGMAPILGHHGIAVARSDKHVVMIDADAGTIHAVSTPGVHDIELSPSGNVLATSQNGSVLIRDVVPRGAAALVTWLRGATNGELDADLTTIRWR